MDIKTCTFCVMDTTAAGIKFDENGQCNFCSDFISRTKDVLHVPDDIRSKRIGEFVNEIKATTGGKKYDCIIGVSGGVDSSWALVKAVELGLKPLAVHMDNGWNSELAQHNIANLVEKLGIDLYTHVIEWHEYRKLMQSFFDADVLDVELLYDNAMLAVNYNLAAKFGVKHILAGTNQATEGIYMPKNWSWFKFDARNIKAISSRYGKVKISSFPAIGIFKRQYYIGIKNIQWVSFLDLFEYNKQNVLNDLQERFHYKPYPYKHYESVFTRFYQGYILPRKFGVDKRKIHFANLIATGQMDRGSALKLLKEIPYPSERELEEDKKYFLKKMGWTAEELEDYLKRPERSHKEFPSSRPLFDFYVRGKSWIRRRMKT